MARPSSYTKELGDEICRRIEDGESLLQICSSDKMPSRDTVRVWLRDDRFPEFSANYARAREESAHASADLIKELARRVAAGDLDANAARVAIDAEKWAAGRRKPKVYGDRQIVDVGDDTLRQLSDERVEARLTELLGKAGIALAAGGKGKAEG